MQEQGSMPDMLGQGNQGDIVNQFANGTSWPNGNICDELAQEQNTDIMSEYDDEDIYKAAPIPMYVRKKAREMINQNNNTAVETNNDNNILPDYKTNEAQQEELKPVNKIVSNSQPTSNIPQYIPVSRSVPNVSQNIEKKRKSNNKWQIIVFVIASILLIGALVLAILAALGFFKKKDDTLSAGNETGNNVNNTNNINDDDIGINGNTNGINNNNNTSAPNIETHNNIDGQYDSGVILSNGRDSSDTTISGNVWDGISKSDGLLTNGDINYTDRFKEIVSCENAPNVTYTLWKDLNGDGVCQVNEILAKGKGFMVDGNCAIINGRKFTLTDNMQAYSNLNKLSNQELKVLNHTSTYWKDGTPHVILDGIKTSVNIDTDHVGGVLNIEGYKIGDFSTTNISKNAFAKDVIDSYLNNNNLTENQKKLVSAWRSGRSSGNVKQLMEYHDMDNDSSKQNLKDTHQEKGQNI